MFRLACFSRRDPDCVQDGGSVVAENPISGIAPTEVKLPAELNKSNYHLLSTYYVPGSFLGTENIVWTDLASADILMGRQAVNK